MLKLVSFRGNFPIATEKNCHFHLAHNTRHWRYSCQRSRARVTLRDSLHPNSARHRHRRPSVATFNRPLCRDVSNSKFCSPPVEPDYTVCARLPVKVVRRSRSESPSRVFLSEVLVSRLFFYLSTFFLFYRFS